MHCVFMYMYCWFLVFLFNWFKLLLKLKHESNAQELCGSTSISLYCDMTCLMLFISGHYMWALVVETLPNCVK
jgi:hypothetical protein